MLSGSLESGHLGVTTDDASAAVNPTSQRAYEPGPSSPSLYLPHFHHMHRLERTQMWADVTHAFVSFQLGNVQRLGRFDYPRPGSAAAAGAFPQPTAVPAADTPAAAPAMPRQQMMNAVQSLSTYQMAPIRPSRSAVSVQARAGPVPTQRGLLPRAPAQSRRSPLPRLSGSLHKAGPGAFVRLR